MQTLSVGFRSFSLLSPQEISQVYPLCISCAVEGTVVRYLIPFNPLPFLLWLCFRRKKWYPQLFRIYTLILVVSVPLLYIVTCQADLAHAFISLTLAVRTFSYASGKDMKVVSAKG